MAADSTPVRRELGAVSIALPAFLADVSSYRWRDGEEQRLLTLDSHETPPGDLDSIVAAKHQRLATTYAGDGHVSAIAALPGTRFPNRLFVLEAELGTPFAMHFGGLQVGAEVVLAMYIVRKREDSVFEHLLRTFALAAAASGAAGTVPARGFRIARFLGFAFEVPAALLDPTSFAFEGEGVRVAVDLREPFMPSRADLASELRAEAPESLLVIDEPVRDQLMPSLVVTRRKYSVRAEPDAEAAIHTFQVSYLARPGGRLVASIFAHGAPASPDVETIVRLAEGSLKEYPQA